MFSDNEESEDEDVDPFEELEVSATAPAARGNSLLDAFEDEEHEESETETEMEGTIVLNSGIEVQDDMVLDSEEVVDDEDDVDPFAELGASRTTQVEHGSSAVTDALAAFMDDEDDEYREPENTISLDEDSSEQEEDIEVEEEAKSETVPDNKDLYRVLLEGVWVDDVLDPAEVALMARKRRQLGISFSEHLDILKEILHE